MRESCKECVIKHLGNAAALMDEMYTESFVLAIGELGQAEIESRKEWPQVSVMIRAFRKEYFNNKDLDIVPLILAVLNIID